MNDKTEKLNPIDEFCKMADEQGIRYTRFKDMMVVVKIDGKFNFRTYYEDSAYSVWVDCDEVLSELKQM